MRLLAVLLAAGCGQSAAPSTASPTMTGFPATALPMTALPATAAVPPARDLASAQLGPADVAPACQPSDTATGSLHANVLYEVSAMPTPSGGKARQGFLCGLTPGVVLYFAFSTDREATDAAGIAGAQLWGGPRPTAAHGDQVLRSGPVLAIVSSTSPQALVSILQSRRGFVYDYGGGAAPPFEARAPVDLDAPTIAALRAAMACAAPPELRYCQALDRFAQGSPPSPWPTPMLGASIHVQPGPHLEEPGYLVVRPEGLRYGEVTASSPEEAAQMRAVVAMLGAGAPVPPTDPVHRYVQSLASEPVGTASAVGRSLHTHPTNGVFVRDVGTEMIVVEVADVSPRTAPFYVGIFPKR